MSYAIIGAGSIGSALAKQFSRNGINVMLANSQGPASLAAKIGEWGPTVKAVSLDHALMADIVILAIPFEAVPKAGSSIRDWEGRVVVDPTNAIEFPAFKPMNLAGKASTEIVAAALPGAKVVKAFNTIPAAILAADPAEHGGRRVVFVSGNDSDANKVVSDLIGRLGFAPITLGSIASGTPVQQFGGPLVAQDLILMK